MSGLLRPVGPEPVQTYLAHAYIVTPKTTDRLCALPDTWRIVM
jgi:hypothetical protein